MAEKIYIRNASGELEPVTEERFKSEELLQELIGQHPELLAGEQMRPDDPLRWILIRREMPIEGWAVDHLLIDQYSRPTLVEVKRGVSREIRRTIVGQMLDYAATAASVWSERDMRRIFEESSDNPDDEIGHLVGGDDEPDIDGFWEQVATNLDANRLRLLFVADEIPTELERVVKFLNAQTRDNLEVLAVEVKQYPGQFGQALVSRVIGQVDTPSTGRPSNRSGKLRRDEFLGTFPSDVSDAVESLLHAAEKTGAIMTWGSSTVGVRVKCSLWRNPVTIARFYLPTTENIGKNREFTFHKNRYDEYPEELQTALDQWVGKFTQDSFGAEVNDAWDIGVSVNAADFVENVGLLTSRLCETLSEFAAL